MKQKEIILLVVIVFFAGLFSFILSKSFINPPSKRSAKVPVAEAIKSDFPDTANDPSYQVIFNSNALDPTQLIIIGDNQNNKPFGDKPQ